MSPQPPLSAAVRVVEGRPTLLVNDQVTYPMFHALTHWPGGRWAWEEMPQAAMRGMAKAGVRLFQVETRLYWMFDDASGHLDLDHARRQVRGVLDVCPDAAVVFRMQVDASPAWCAAHPSECCAFADPGPLEPDHDHAGVAIQDSEIRRPTRYSLASRAWLDDARAKLSQFCRAFADTPEGNHVIGIHVAAGVFGEWHQWGFIDHEPDTGPAMTAHFRRWLTARYETDAALRQAWADPTVTLATAAVPDLAARKRVDDGIFLDPRAQRPLIDYHEAQHDVVADDIVALCEVVKADWPRPVLTGAFYGYFFMLFGRHAAGGHLALHRVLRSPAVDYLSAPQAYGPTHRDMGGSGQSRGLPDVCRSHGKLWLDEVDQNTSLHQGEKFRSQQLTLDDDLAMVRRNLAGGFTRGGGMWMYDFGAGYGGWWSHPRLLAEIGRLHGIFQARYRAGFTRAADVLVVYDLSVLRHTARTWRVDCMSNFCTDDLSATLYRSGACFDELLLADLERLDLSGYKLVVFANTFRLTPDQRRFVRDRVMRDGRHVAFVHLPGYTDGERNDLAFVRELTGLDLSLVTPKQKPTLRVDLGQGDAADSSIWHPVPLPVFQPGEGVETIGTLDGQPAAARVTLADATEWFFTLPPTDPRVWRRVFEQAGVHVYLDPGHTLLIGHGLACVHTAAGGSVTFRPRSAPSRPLTLPPRSSTILDAETGEEVT